MFRYPSISRFLLIQCLGIPHVFRYHGNRLHCCHPMGSSFSSMNKWPLTDIKFDIYFNQRMTLFDYLYTFSGICIYSNPLGHFNFTSDLYFHIDCAALCCDPSAVKYGAQRCWRCSRFTKSLYVLPLLCFSLVSIPTNHSHYFCICLCETVLSFQQKYFPLPGETHCYEVTGSLFTFIKVYLIIHQFSFTILHQTITAAPYDNPMRLTGL